MWPVIRRFALSFASFLVLCLCWFNAPPVRADGMIVLDCPPIVYEPEPVPQPLPMLTAIPPRPVTPPPTRSRDCRNYLSVKNHNVTVTITNQVAVTHVDETFFNDSSYQLEGSYVFPLPSDAAIDDFAMWVDGKRLDGQVLDSDKARQVYEDIVRRQRDPALLEYVGRNAFQARIFPIPPQSTKRVEIEYSQVLQAQNGLVRYVYPLDTERFSPTPVGSVSIDVSIKSSAAIRAIYSPSHAVAVSRQGDYAATVGYEDSHVKPDRDYVLYYSLTPDAIGVNLLSYRSGADDGFFVLLVAPPVQADASQVVSKDVIMVLDTSGSMQGQKIDQAKRALDYVLEHLNPADRFNIIAFSTATNPYAAVLQPMSRRSDAERFVAQLKAEGSTDLNRALLEAVAESDGDRPTTIIFLTDGLPTTGEIDSEKIMANVTRAAPSNVRLFAFGVGDDVNTVLLDTLAEKLRGASGYVRPDEAIDEVVSSFYAQVSMPVLSDVSVDWGEADVSDVFPYPLPDLFAGTQLVVAGRYRNSGPATITLRGTVNGQSKTIAYSDLDFNPAGGRDRTGESASFVPRLWATRKIGYLLSQIRLHGETKEAVDQIVSLAVRYGIVTPYTSFLVNDQSDVLTDSGRHQAAQDLGKSVAPSAMPATGAGAVQQSQQQNQMRGAVAAPTAAPPPAAPGEEEQPSPIQSVADKTFVLREGVWIDTQFDPSKMATTKIGFGSDPYFALAASTPAAAQYLALGQKVIVVIDGTAYEVTDSGAAMSSSPAPSPSAAPSPSELAMASPTDVGAAATGAKQAPVQAAVSRDAGLVAGCGMVGAGLVVSGIALFWVGVRKRLEN